MTFDFIDEKFSTIVAKDLANMTFGEKLGSGISREVYTYMADKTLIIKVELKSSYQNVREHEIWNEIKDSIYAKYFAPCVDISPAGVYLLQKRTIPILQSEFPKKVPHFLTDLKYQNFGWYVEKGKRPRIVCHDYGSVSLTHGWSKKLKKAEWWDL